MISYQEALERILAQAQPITETETVPLMYSTNRVLAEDVVSPIDVPGWNNSQMDGYAVRAADLEGASAASPVMLPVSERITAGDVGAPLPAGTAARIFTGAPMPDGADAVVPQEEVVREGDTVRFQKPIAVGKWVRVRGSDVPAGEVVLQKGERLTPAAIGMIASIGRAYVTVYRKLRVGIFFSGNELVQPGEPLPPGGIYNSNRFMMRSLLVTLGFEAIDLGSIPDSLEATVSAFERACESADVIVTTGGMSVGEEDHIKPAVERLGRIDVWRVSLKPGKPLAFGEVKGIPFIGLPGNPVSGFVVFLMIARPYLLRRSGLVNVDMRAQHVRADFTWEKRAIVKSSCACAATMRAGSTSTERRIRRCFQAAHGPTGWWTFPQAPPSSRATLSPTTPSANFSPDFLSIKTRARSGECRSRAFFEHSMKIRILYFAALRDAVGRTDETLELDAEKATLSQVREALIGRGEPWAGAFANLKRVRGAVNQVMAEDDAVVADGDEVAFFPPVTGG